MSLGMLTGIVEAGGIDEGEQRSSNESECVHRGSNVERVTSSFKANRGSKREGPGGRKRKGDLV